MYRPIHFDDNSWPRTVEIHDESGNWYLPPEFQAQTAAPPQALPHPPLRIGRVPPHRLGEASKKLS